MVSLAIFGVFLLTWALLTSWAVAWTARRAGSTRGTYWRGLWITGVQFMVGSVGVLLIRPKTIGGAVIALLVQFGIAWVVFMMIRRTFSLPTKRTWVPFGALIAVGFVYGAVAYGVIHPFVAEGFLMPTESMSPTVMPGDRIMVNKLLAPRRWDVVAFHVDFNGEQAIWCKRVVGMPGDRLRLEQNALYIGDAKMDLPAAMTGNVLMQRYGQYRNGETIQLAADEYFVIGDQMDKSIDSRITGPIKHTDLIGVVDWIYWPMERMQLAR